ncbi:carotenoid biosynthesis protein [Actinospongicola halichondriae]|uniref:carotenoid biosynthesis protein n=1 Tax=Actinospongicola halichondriae TaxID=3236844 RepID=UPI003D49AA56
MGTLVAGGAAMAFGVMALSQIAIPLTDDRATTEWLSSLVVTAFFATSLLLVVHHWGPRRALLSAGFVVVATLLVERIGSTTGFPFGEYDYSGALEPTVGSVPVIVPLAWFAMGVPALEVGHRVARSRAGAVVVGAIALTAWDLFLDPQMVDNDYWHWAADGAYDGIPLSNYLGWLGVGVVVLAVVDRLRPTDEPVSTPLVALYTWWAVMNTIGFVVFFDKPFVGLVGGIGMCSVAAVAWLGSRLGRAGVREVARG